MQTAFQTLLLLPKPSCQLSGPEGEADPPTHIPWALRPQPGSPWAWASCRSLVQAASVISPTRNEEEAWSTRVGEDGGPSWPAEVPLLKLQECLQSFPRGSLGPQCKGPPPCQAASHPLVPGSLQRGGGEEDRSGPLPHYQSALPAATCGGG